MWRTKSAQFLILALTGMLLFPNCATLTQKKTQIIPVTSSPPGATVFVNGIEQGPAPVQVELVRKLKGQVIRIESPGYTPYEIQLKRRPSPIMDLADVILGVALGVVLTNAYVAGDPEIKDFVLVAPLVMGTSTLVFLSIDRTTKKSFEFRPKNLTVTLTKADGTPRVDTILIDAEDFRNVKWIRVRND